MRLKFARRGRLARSSEITFVLRQGRQYRGALFDIRYLPNNFGHDRFAVLVGRKHGNAVRRNRLKRVYREVFRRNPPLSNTALDIVIRPHYKCRSDSEAISKEYHAWREQ